MIEELIPFIKKCAAIAAGVSEDDMDNKSRKGEFVLMRHVVHHFIMTSSKLQDKQVANLTYRLDRTSIIHSVRVVNGWIEINDHRYNSYNDLFYFELLKNSKMVDFIERTDAMRKTNYFNVAEKKDILTRYNKDFSKLKEVLYRDEKNQPTSSDFYLISRVLKYFPEKKQEANITT